MKTLKDDLEEWSSRERAVFRLGRHLGVFETDFERARAEVAAGSPVVTALEFVLNSLAVFGVLEYDVVSEQYRWKPSFVWRKG